MRSRLSLVISVWPGGVEYAANGLLFMPWPACVGYCEGGCAAGLAPGRPAVAFKLSIHFGVTFLAYVVEATPL